GFNFSSEYDLDLSNVEAAFTLVRSAQAAHRLKGDARSDLLAQLQHATTCARGSFLEGFSLGDAPDFDDWARMQREVWHRRLSLLFDRLSHLQFEGAELESALETTARWVAHDPLSEVAYQRLMRAQFAAGNREAALAAYDTYQARLWQELHAHPTPETKALAERIRTTVPPLRHVPHQAQASLPPAAALEGSLPFVGRVSEYLTLVERYHRASGSQLQVVLLEGEAGIGKTRLASEFLAWAAAQGADVLQGQAFEAGGRVPYQPVVDALRPRLERENAPEDLLSDSWLTELSRLLPELRDRYPDLPASTFNEAVARTRLFEAVARLGQALAARTLLVVFLDDLHSADAASLDLLHYAGRRWKEWGVPLLLLLSLRSEALLTTPLLSEWLSGLERDLALTHLTLESLNLEATVQLVQSLARERSVEAHLPSSFVPPAQQEEAQDKGMESPEQGVEQFGRWLFTETGGQPFFLVETLRVLLERGVVIPRRKADGAWGLDVAPATQNEAILRGLLPPSVRELIRRRLVRLSPVAFGLLAAGAVLGQDFSFAQLCQVAGSGENEGLSALDEVLLHRLLQASWDKEGRGAEVAYGFTHDKIREVVYTEAGEARRQVFHRRALDALQTAAAPPAHLAHHALHAQLPEPTFRFSLAAGDAAAQLFAHTDAHLHYMQALEALSHLPDTEINRRQHVDTILKLVRVSWFADAPQSNLAWLAEAEALAQNLPDPHDGSSSDRLRLARIHFWMSQVHVTANAMREAMSYLQQVQLEAREEGDEELLALASVQMGRALTAQGQFGKSKPLLVQAVTLLEKAANWPEWIFAASFLGMALAGSGHYAAGVVQGQRALARAQEMKVLTSIAMSHICLSTISLMGGEIGRMLEESRTTVEVAEQSGNRFIAYLGYGFRGWAESRLGRHEAARRSMAHSQAVGESMGGKLLLGDWLAAANAEIVLSAGRVEEALTLAEETVSIAHSVGDFFAEGLAHRVWGQALATLNPPRWDEAEMHFTASLRALEPCGAIPEAARTHLAWGLLCRDRGDSISALKHFEAATVQFETAGLTRELERTHKEMVGCK
ncbi:MAG TPA: AAA family ATPase, partial [Ktedonobacteraceae bacterium]